MKRTHTSAEVIQLGKWFFFNSGKNKYISVLDSEMFLRI